MEITNHKSCGCHTERKINVSPKEKKQAAAVFGALLLAWVIYYLYQRAKDKPVINQAIVANSLIQSANLTIQEQAELINYQSYTNNSLEERVRDLERCFVVI